MLLTEIHEIKRSVAINMTMEFASIEPYVLLAERKYIKPILGLPLYNKLLAAYNSSGSASGSAASALDLLLAEVQWTLSYLAVWEYVVHIGSAQISDAGITEQAVGDQKAARKWVNDKVEQSHGATAMEGLDSLLAYLEVNKASFPDWEASGNFTLYFDCLTYSTATFEQYYPIGNSRRVFLALKPSIRAAERQRLNPLLGSALYTELLTQLKEGTLTALNKALLPYVQEAAVYIALQKALPQLAVKVTSRGLTLDGAEGTLEENYTQKPADSMKIGALQREIDTQASMAVERLQTYLNAKAADYPLFVVPTSTAIDQSEKKGWVF